MRSHKVCGASTQTLRLKNQLIRVIFYSFHGGQLLEMPSYGPTHLGALQQALWKTGLSSELCPTRLKLFNSRGAHFFPVRKFSPTRLKIFSSRGAHFLPVQKFSPTRLKILNSRGADKLIVQISGPTTFKLFQFRGAGKSNLQISGPTTYKLF